MPKISVIVPVYNTKTEYIKQALESINNQTLKDIEIIIVNDGSNNKETLDYLNTIPENIKIINQENRGLGGARNTGIKNSTGECISFLDSDDWLDNNYYEILYNLIKDTGADIACATLTRVIKDKNIPMDMFENKVCIKLADKIRYIHNGSVCSKLFKREMFDKLSFQEHIYREDNPVLLQAFLESNKIAFSKDVNYYYRENTDSICLNPTGNKKRLEDGIKILKQIEDISKNCNKEEANIIMKIFSPILINPIAYSKDKEYRKSIKKSFSNKIIKNAINGNGIIENIFSIKNTQDRKIITILGIKIKIKRKGKICKN